jgi:hypothetical protein
MVGHYHYENIENFGIWGQAHDSFDIFDSFKKEFWWRKPSMITFAFMLCCYTKLHIANEANYRMNLEHHPRA